MLATDNVHLRGAKPGGQLRRLWNKSSCNSQVRCLSDNLKAGLTLPGKVEAAAESNPRPSTKPSVGKPAKYDDQHVQSALMGLDFHNNKGGSQYELVKPRVSRLACVSRKCVYHLNFTAKLKGDPSAPIELFFAQLIRTGPHSFYATHSENLGPCTSLPADQLAEGICNYCSHLRLHHPPNKDFIGACLP